MKQEKSCGAVIFREENTARNYLIITSTLGHTTLCKGHVEKNETEHETAVREIMEETALTVDFIPGFREVITYSPFENCTKDVVFFLGKVSGGRLTCQPEEVADARFLPFEAALESLTHASDKTILQEARRFLENR